MFLQQFIFDGVVKSSLLRHSRAGGNPERIEMTGSKSSLISHLRGNDEMAKYFSFYETIIFDKLVKATYPELFLFVVVRVCANEYRWEWQGENR